MATLQITATPSDKIRRYKLAIDHKKVKMGANNKGSFELPENDCGDGTRHKLGCAMRGSAGATLTIKITCNGTDIPMPVLEIFPEVEPLGGGTVEFDL